MTAAQPGRPRSSAGSPCRALPGLGLLLALLQVASPATSTTYVVMLDEALFDQADVVAEVTLLQRRPGFGARAAVTDHFASVDRVIKGSVPWSTLVVRSPGGTTPDGTLVIPGSPRLAPGDRALLFLLRNRDDTFSPLHLGLGSFVRVGTGADALAVRPLEGSVLLDRNLEPTADLVRNYDKFVDWLAERERGGVDPPDYYLERGNLPRNTVSDFTLMEWDEKNVRWFRFDDGEALGWRIGSTGAPGSNPPDAQPQFEAALAAWSLAPVQLELSGSTDSSAGFEGTDGENSIIFGDPNNEVAGTYSCEDGGTLASGGWWQRDETGEFNGESFVRLFEADIVVNDGADCLLRSNKSASAEVFTHELGHTLGIAHSCGDTEDACSGQIRLQATMRSNLHNDGRGAEIRVDDAAALAFLYGTPSPPEIESTPDSLSARATKATVAQLSWADNSVGESTFEVWGRSGGRQFRLFATEGANTASSTLKGLEPRTQYEFKVRANIDGLLTLFSSLVSVTTPEAKLNRPKRLKAKALGPTFGRLKWKDKSSNERKFLIQRRIGSGKWSSWRKAAANSTSLDFDDAESGVTYSFRVRAKKSGEKSAFSNVATLTMP